MSEAHLHPLSRAEDPISPALREVLALFGDALHGIKFPDVDADALGLQALQVEEHFGVLKKAEQAQLAARKQLEESQEALLQKAWRAVAYARVYADGDPRLSARLEAIAFPLRSKSATTPPTEAPKKRGRPKNGAAADTSLFAVPEPVDAVDVDDDQAA